MIFLTDFKVFLRDPRPLLAVPPHLMDPWNCARSLTWLLTSNLPAYICYPADLNSATDMRRYSSFLREMAKADVIRNALLNTAIVSSSGDGYAVHSEAAKKDTLKFRPVRELNPYLYRQCIEMRILDNDKVTLDTQFKALRDQCSDILDNQKGLLFSLRT